MPKRSNRQIILVKRPVGMPDESIFRFVEVPMPDLKEGEVLVKSEYISVDPYMRGRMSERKSYTASYSLNEVITGGVIGRVKESRSALLEKGDYVTGSLAWAEYSVSDAKSLRRIDPGFVPVTSALSVLGMTGMTAYFGLLDVGRPKERETVVISAAAGAVGSAVGQIAKIKGCRAVGITGSKEKVKFLIDELHFDAAVNYKETRDLRKSLEEACPKGVDVYFDNVGGEISDAVMTLINDKARIPICGQISLYNAKEPPVGPRIQQFLLTHTALMQGFLVRQYNDRFGEAVREMALWFEEGKLKDKITVSEGFENVPKAFIGLFKGENIGKQLVKV